MFRSARLKLTAWYVLGIMLISIVFSIVAYWALTPEIRRGMYMQALHAEALGRGQGTDGNEQPPAFTPRGPFIKVFPGPPRAFDPQLFAEAQSRVATRLIILNIGIFILAGATGYFLSGRTLRPIEEMVNDQKRFVADASHELRTPLTAMRTEIEVALRDKGLDAASAKDVLQSNLEEIGKLQLFSDHLLTLGRYQSAANNREFTEVKLIDVVEKAYQEVQPLAEAKNTEIQSDIDDIAIKADKESLTKLFVIFLDNAIKYSNENGKVFINAKALKNEAIINIQDFGIGIRASDIPYIFNRFYRADASRSKTNVSGYGLGLSIAKSIIDIHNGKVNVESTPDQGTTFTITLPLKH